MHRFLLTLIVFLALVAGCSDNTPDAGESFDVLIVNGTVYDGTLSPGAVRNIGIRGERIVSLDAPANATATQVIDASGLTVFPGFIDPHTHAEDDLFEVPTNQNANYLTQAVTTVFIGNDGAGVPDRETNVAAMREQGVGSNVAFFSGHGDARRAAMGLENRAPTDEEMETMRRFVAADMEAGALGLSTGLFYTPGSFSETEEVIELAKVSAEYGGVYDSHIRDESSYTIGLLGAIQEVIRIGEEADLPVHIAHLKALGRDVWGQSGDIIGIVSAARERGVKVTADQYPWQASGTSLLSSLVPAWARADSAEATEARLVNEDLRDRLREEMDGNLWRRGGAESLLITGESEWRGMTLEQVAEQMDTDPISAAIEVIRGGNPGVASFNMNLDDVQAMAIQPWVMTGSDGSPGHPRKYASYPKAYRDWVVDSSLMTMEKYVHRSSALVADTFGLCDRGYLEAGRRADIAIIDPDTFRPVADFDNPTALSTGVVHLLVNGQAAIADRELTGTLAGQVIDRQNLECP